MSIENGLLKLTSFTNNDFLYVSGENLKVWSGRGIFSWIGRSCISLFAGCSFDKLDVANKINNIASRDNCFINISIKEKITMLRDRFNHNPSQKSTSANQILAPLLTFSTSENEGILSISGGEEGAVLKKLTCQEVLDSFMKGDSNPLFNISAYSSEEQFAIAKALMATIQSQNKNKMNDYLFPDSVDFSKFENLTREQRYQLLPDPKGGLWGDYWFLFCMNKCGVTDPEDRFAYAKRTLIRGVAYSTSKDLLAKWGLSNAQQFELAKTFAQTIDRQRFGILVRNFPLLTDDQKAEVKNIAFTQLLSNPVTMLDIYEREYEQDIAYLSYFSQEQRFRLVQLLVSFVGFHIARWIKDYDLSDNQRKLLAYECLEKARGSAISRSPSEKLIRADLAYFGLPKLVHNDITEQLIPLIIAARV